MAGHRRRMPVSGACSPERFWGAPLFKKDMLAAVFAAMSNKRICNRCKGEKPLGDFYAIPEKICKACTLARNREYYFRKRSTWVRTKKTCAICGLLFDPYRPGDKACSVPCSREWNKIKKQEYQRLYYERNRVAYILKAKDRRAKRRTAQESRLCNECGAEFKTIWRNKQFCNSKCRGRFARRFMTAEQKAEHVKRTLKWLKTPRGKQLSVDRKRRDRRVQREQAIGLELLALSLQTGVI